MSSLNAHRSYRDGPKRGALAGAVLWEDYRRLWALLKREPIEIALRRLCTDEAGNAALALDRVFEERGLLVENGILPESGKDLLS